MTERGGEQGVQQTDMTGSFDTGKAVSQEDALKPAMVTVEIAGEILQGSGWDYPDESPLVYRP